MRAAQEAERVRAEHEAAMKAARKAEQRARAEREAVARAAREAEERARAQHEAAVRAAREAEERARAQHEAEMRAAREAEERARAQREAAMRAAEAEAARLRAEQEENAKIAREQARIQQAAQEAAMKEMEEATKRAAAEREAAMRAAAERERKEREAQEAAARAAKEESDRAKAAQEEAERKLRQGVQLEVWPTDQEREIMRRNRQYTEGLFHIAIAGISGSGKSSLINAFLGLRNNDKGAAATGITETTALITRYPSRNPNQPFVWYDVPGAGTLNIPDWQYFNAQGLYIFNCIIVLFDNRFTATDIAVLKNCERFGISSFVVRSKSNQHIRNIALDMGYNEDDDSPSARHIAFQAAREKYIAETRQSVQRNLEEANLPLQRVYIVAKDTLRSVIHSKIPKDIIDEVQLIQDLRLRCEAILNRG